MLAHFYDNAALVPLIRFGCLAIVFKGAMSARAHVAIKQMYFKRWVLINNGGGVCGILTAVLLTFALENVWALVIGFTVEAR